MLETGQAIRADPNRLKQLFENLFRNALEHGGDDLTVTIGDCPGGFYVADDGPGIPSAEWEDLIDAGYSTRERGSGFGLAIAEQVAVAHDWEVSVSDADGGGARFEVTGVDTLDA